jgi:hypothetical protein
MTTRLTTPSTTTVKLTPDQKDLVRGVQGMAERAARDTMIEVGRIRPWDAMVRSAHYGIALAARDFDAGMGKWEDWAYHKACWTILDDAKIEGRQERKLLAARLAAREFLRYARQAPRDDDVHNTEQQDATALSDYMGGALAGYLEGVALMPTAAGSEDEMHARIDASRAAEKLKEVYGGLEPRQVELLRCASEADLKKLAEAWGKSWWTLARAKAKLQKVVGARLAGRDMNAMPSWDEEIWRSVAGDLDRLAAPEDL